VSDSSDTTPFDTAGRVAKNTAVLLTSKFVSKPIYLIYIFIVARTLGVEEFGTYSFCLTFAAFFVVLADFGLKTPVQRAIARDRDKTSLYFVNALVIKTVLVIVTVAVFHIAVRWFDYGSLYGPVLYIAMAFVLVDSGTQMFYNVFRAHEVMHYEAFVGVVQLLLMLLITIAVIELGHGLTAILLVVLACVLLAFLFNAAVYVKRFSTGGGRFEWPVARDFLKMALVFGVGSGFYTLYSKIDILMLERMVGQRSVGLYAASYTLLENLDVISIAYMAAFMPYLFKVYPVSKEKAMSACGRSIGYLLAAGFPFAIGLTFFSKEVIMLLYGSAFVSTAPALEFLVWVLPVKYTFIVLAVLLITLDREVTGIYTGFVGVVANILLNLWLIPLYTHTGAAVATLVTESLMLVMQAVLVVRYAKHFPLPAGLLRLLLANALLALFIWAIRDLGLPVVIPAAAGVYALMLYLFRFITGSEIAFLREVFETLRGRQNTA